MNSAIESGISKGLLEKIFDIQLGRPLDQVAPVELVALHFEHTKEIVPLLL